MAKEDLKLRRWARSSSSQELMSKKDLTEKIRKVAYDLYEKRGRKQGNECADWLEAERLVKRSMQ